MGYGQLEYWGSSELSWDLPRSNALLLIVKRYLKGGEYEFSRYCSINLKEITLLPYQGCLRPGVPHKGALETEVIKRL